MGRQMCAITRTHIIAVTGVARLLPRERGGRRTMHFCGYRGPLMLRGALEGQSWEFSPSGCSLSWGGCAVAVGCFFFILWSHCAWQLPFRRIGLVFCALGVHAGVRLPPF